MRTPSTHPSESTHPSDPKTLLQRKVLGDVRERIQQILDNTPVQDQIRELEKYYIQITPGSIPCGEVMDYQTQEIESLFTQILIDLNTRHTEEKYDNKELGSAPQMETNSIELTFQQLSETDNLPSSLKITDIPIEASPVKLGKCFKKIGNNAQVIELHLIQNRIGRLDCPSLEAIFSQLRNVRTIDLSFNDLSPLDRPSLKAIFSHLGNVKSINLRRNYLGDLDARKLRAIFPNLRNVSTIDLSLNNLSSLDSHALGTIFYDLGNVKSLNLTGNQLGSLDLRRIQAIFRPLVSLEEVIVSQSDVSRLESSFFNLYGKIKIK